MFDFIKKIVIVTILMTLTLGQFEALGGIITSIEERTEGTRKRQRVVVSFDNAQPQSTDVLPRDGLKLVLAEASKEILPTDLQLVCKNWRNVMREKNLPQSGIQFSDLNFFMKQCMNIWWTEKFNNGILRYTSPIDGKIIDQRFSDVLSDFENTKGTFNLSVYGNTSNVLRMTLSVEEFLQVNGDNKDRVVILFATRQMVESLINTKGKAFAEILKEWNPACSVGIFWRWGEDKEFSVDHLTCASVTEISSRNLYENWKKSDGARAATGNWCSDLAVGVGVHAKCFVFVFVNQN